MRLGRKPSGSFSCKNHAGLMVFCPGDGGNILDTGRRRSGEEEGRRRGEGGAPELEGVVSQQPVICPKTSIERLLDAPWNGPCRLHAGGLRQGADSQTNHVSNAVRPRDLNSPRGFGVYSRTFDFLLLDFLSCL